MHATLITAAHAAATAQASAGDRNILAIGVAAAVFILGVATTGRKKKAAKP